MIELQFDAAGRRCIEHIKPVGTPVSFDGKLPPEKPLPTIKPSVSLLMLVANRPIRANIGEYPIDLAAREPFLWNASPGMPHPFGSAEQLITIAAEDPETHVTLLLVQ